MKTKTRFTNLVFTPILALALGPPLPFPVGESMMPQQKGVAPDCVIELAAPLVDLAWVDGPDGLAVRGLMGDEPLSLRVSSRATDPVWIELRARHISGDADETGLLTKLFLPPFSARSVAVGPNDLGMRPDGYGFSSQLLVTGRILDASATPLDEVQAPALFYHADGLTGQMLIYTAEALRRRFHSGLVGKATGLPHDEPITSPDDLGAELEAVGIGGTGIPIGRVAPQGNPADLAAAPGYVKICARLKVAFSDNGFGEDYWPTNSDKDARGVSVRVYDGNGAILYDDFTGDGLGDDDPGLGCTPFLFASNYQNWRMLVYSTAKVQDNTIRVYNSDDQLVYWEITGMNPGAPGAYAYSIPFETQRSTVLAATSYAIYRHAGGMTDKTYHVHTGASSNYSSGGEVYLTSANKRKFTIVHEMGHALLRQKIGSHNANCDYNAPSGPCRWGSASDLHSMSSKEYNSCGFNEGFAHFYAADVWNNHDESDCTYKYYKTVGGVSGPVIDCENGSKYMETTCSSPFAGYGNELDWSRFLWDFHTAGSSKPTFTEITNIIDRANHLPLLGGWGDTSVYDYLVFGAGLYDDGRWASKFETWAEFNGVDH